MIPRLRQRAADETGVVLVLVAVMLVVLMGCAALAIDVGSFYQSQRQAQAAADAGALAGAEDIATSPSSVTTDAANYATTNYPAASTPTVTQPNTDQVKVTINADSPSFFGRFFGLVSATVSASAVASAKNSSNGCAVAGGSNGCYAIFAMSTTCSPEPVQIITGNVTLTGGVHSNGGFNGSGGNDSFGPTTYGTGCAAATKSGQTYASGPASEAPIMVWPYNFAFDYPSCSGTACTGPGGTPPYCTVAAANFPSGYTYTSNNVYCAYGTGTVSAPATWNGTITPGGGSAGSPISAIFIGGTISNASGYLSALNYPTNKLLFYATTGDVTMTGTFTGDVFAPAGAISLNGGSSGFLGFLEGQSVTLQGGGINGDGPQDASGQTYTSSSASLLQ